MPPNGSVVAFTIRTEVSLGGGFVTAIRARRAEILLVAQNAWPVECRAEVLH